MKLAQNVGGIDKVIRIVAGLALIGAGFYLESWIAGIVGAVLLLTGVLGRCGLYYLLNINTCPAKQNS